MRKIYKWLVWLFWLLVIFYMSSQNGAQSQGLSYGILGLLGFKNNLRFLNFIIRKAAHISEFFILYILTKVLINDYSKWSDILALLISFLMACFDEFHQLFVNSRSGLFSDVLIDSIGICLAFIFWHLYEKWKKK